LLAVTETALRALRAAAGRETSRGLEVERKGLDNGRAVFFGRRP
jgi:hypothetical protein